MTMTSRSNGGRTIGRGLLGACALVALAAPAVAREQASNADSREQSRTSGGARTEITPYLEVGQVLVAELARGRAHSGAGAGS